MSKQAILYIGDDAEKQHALEQVKDLARLRKTTMSQYIWDLIREDVKQNGHKLAELHALRNNPDVRSDGTRA